MGYNKCNFSNVKNYIMLHILMFFFSLTGICSKMASKYNIWEWQFMLYYGLVIFIMMLYTIGWQNIIKRLPLTIAYANKAITIIWAGIWGILLFDEEISILRIVSYIVIIIGIVVYVTADKERDYNE